MVKLTEDQFDHLTVKGTGRTISVRSFTWENENKVSVQVITYGATITFMKVPDKKGTIKDVVTGFKNLEGYLKADNPYFGATVGRVANRVASGQFTLFDEIIQVTKNHGKHQLHGGFVGFDKSRRCKRQKFTFVLGYQNPFNRYFGATIGRVANRINKATVKIDSTSYLLSVNHGAHHLHGGLKGFDKEIWQYFVDGNKVIMSYHSADLEEGYPGDLVVHTIFELTETNEFRVEFNATTTKSTYVNMTNHSYFNLAGHNTGATELYKHVVCINADQTTEVDADSIPTGKLLPVADTVFNLQIPKVLGDLINNVPNTPGFDHNFCITKGPEQGNTFIARVYHPESGRVLEVYSNQPGVQFYTSNFFPENPSTYKGDKRKLATLSGKDDSHYYKHGAFCLETQNWPDAANHKNFPKAILHPGETYYHYVAYKFSVKN